jgi:flagellar hook-associated protein 1
MPKIHGIMDVGRRSMANSQTAISTSAHNIANQGVEGFSRQRVELKTAPAFTYGNVQIGTGSRTGAVTRTNNPFLEKQIGKEQAALGFGQGQADILSQVEQVFNEQNGPGLNSYMVDFFNSFREFANNPESLATRTNVRESANIMVKDFNRVAGSLKQIQKGADSQMSTYVSEVNGYTKEIASLNEKIQQVEISGADANDERDRRDLMIKKLGEKVNIKWAEGKDTQVTITAGNSVLLVGGNESKNLYATATEARPGKQAGSIDIMYKSNPHGEFYRVTEQITGGSLGGLIEARDGSVNGLLGRVNDMAFTLAEGVNYVHRTGFDGNNRPGKDFFNLGDSSQPGGGGSAENISLAEHIKRDPSTIAGAGDPNSPGDNRVANRIAAMQFEALANNGKVSLDEYYNTIVGEVGIQARRVGDSVKTQAETLKQMQNLRESISGVSLDEEATKLIEYHKAFEASARLIKTADEMFDTVLNLKRL